MHHPPRIQRDKCSGEAVNASCAVLMFSWPGVGLEVLLGSEGFRCEKPALLILESVRRDASRNSEFLGSTGLRKISLAKS